MPGRVCAVSLILQCASGVLIAQAPIAIRQVTVIDGTGAAPMPNATVIIQGQRIAAIGPSDRVRIPENATVIEARGKYLIPGLIDTHAHIASSIGTPKLDRMLAFALAHGVTGLRDASGIGRERELVALRERIERGEVMAPRLYVSGTGSPQNIGRHQATDLADLVRRLRQLGVDGIKLRNINSAQADTIIRAARAAGIPAFGHTYGPDPIGDFTTRALVAGATGVMHVNGLGPAQQLQPRSVIAADWQKSWLALHLKWIDASAGEETSLVELFLRNNAWLEPTLTIIAFDSHDEWYRDRPETRIAERVWGQSYDELRVGYPKFTGTDLELARQGFTRMQAFVRRFADAGGQVITGTDMTPWLSAGVHEELRLLVDAGLSPMAALQAATRNSARALGWDSRTGTIVVGRDADLVLLDANPLEDITNSRRIHAVLRAGRVVDRNQTW